MKETCVRPEAGTELERLYEVFRACRGVCTDSRKIRPGGGQLFFALRGERFDGNRYAALALEQGAAYAAVDDPRAVVSERFLYVKDALAALQELAALHRRRRGVPVLAITGSNGKTTTKELVSRVLARKFKVHTTRGNLNNHIGVPLTLLEMPDEAQLAVVEMGANHRGEIAALCRIARPDYGLVTNIGRAHLEGFGGPEGIEKGKGELYDSLDATGGTAFYDSDSETLSRLVAERPRMKKVPYASSAWKNVSTGDTLSVEAEGVTVRSALVGDYNRPNLACALAVGRYFGVAPEEAKAAVESFVPENNRSQKQATGRNLLIVDAYNANPSSMEAALRNFARLADPEGRPKWVVLGDMKELGTYSAAEHRRMVELVVREVEPEKALWVGKEFSAAARACGLAEADTFEDAAAAAAWLAECAPEGKTVLVKGSRYMELEKVIPLF